MPVTVYPTSNEARPWNGTFTDTEGDFFQGCCGDHIERVKHHSQFTNLTTTAATQISPSPNGLVHAAWSAYSHHHHLIIRPEDVWFAILVQLAFYLNANPKSYDKNFMGGRERFDENGKSLIEVGTLGWGPSGLDVDSVVVEFTEMLDERLVDKKMREWIQPDFTTTTKDDKVVSSLLLLGQVKESFEFSTMMTCGLPSVTLLGEREDWQEIRKRLARFSKWSNETDLFADGLDVVVAAFIGTFDKPNNTEVKNFWNRITSEKAPGSEQHYLTGWISAFTFWDVEGRLLERNGTGDDSEDFLKVNEKQIPVGHVSVPIRVDNMEFEFLAGSIGISATSSSNSSNGTLDTIQPASGWMMYELNEALEAEKKKAKGKSKSH